MRIAFTADLHIDEYGTGPVMRRERLADYLRTTRWVARRAVEEGCEALVVAGDFTEKGIQEKRVPKIRRALNVGPARQVYLRGNHDQQEAAEVDEAGMRTAPPDSIVTLLDDGHLHTGVAKPELQVISSDVVLACIPYLDLRWLRAYGGCASCGHQHPEGECAACECEAVASWLSVPSAQALAALGSRFVDIARGLYSEAGSKHPDAAVVLVIHQTLALAWMSDGQMAELGDKDLVIDTAALAGIGFEAIVAGHLHKHQTLQSSMPVLYTGAIERVDFGEALQDKVFVIADVERGRFDWRVVEIPARRYVTLTGEQVYDEDVDITGAIVRVQDLDRSYEARAVRSHLMARGAFDVTGIVHTPAERIEPANALTEGLTPYQAASAYFAGHPDADALLDLARELLQEASAVPGHTKAALRGGGGLRPLQIELCHFMGHDHLVIRYEDARLWIFEGENGSGKSAAASEALQYVLYGRARLPIDELVQWGQSDMSVTLLFEQRDIVYRIRRERFLRGGGASKLDLQEQKSNGSFEPVLESGGIPETQVALEAIVGMSFETFRSAVLLGQRDLLRFAGGSSDDRGSVVDQVVGNGDLAKAEALAKRRQDELKATVKAGRESLERLQAHIDELAWAKEAVERWSSTLAILAGETALLATMRDSQEAELQILAGEIAKADAAKGELDQLEEQLTQLRSRYAATAADKAEAEAAISRAEAVLERAVGVKTAVADLEQARVDVAVLEVKEAKLAELQETLRKALEGLRSEEQRHEADVAAFEGKRAQLAAVASHAETQAKDLQLTVCSGCGKRTACVHVAGLARALEVARQELNAVGDPPALPLLAIGRARNPVTRTEDRIRALAFDPDALRAARQREREALHLAGAAGEMEQARVALKRATVRLTEAKDVLASISADGVVAKERRDQAKERAVTFVALSADRARVAHDLEGTKQELRGRDAKRAEAAAQLARAEAAVADLERVRDEVTVLAERLAADDVAFARLTIVRAGFGPAGIPARVVESVLPELAVYANELLEKLRPGFVLSFRTLKVLKGSDAVRPTLDLIVSDDGAEHRYEAYSGGEQMSVALACAVALSRLSASRAGAAQQALIVDEPDGLDRPRRQAFSAGMRQLTHDGKLALVAVISHHDDLAEPDDTVLRFSDQDGRSVVELAA